MPLPQLPYKRPFFAMTLSPHEIEVSMALAHSCLHCPSAAGWLPVQLLRVVGWMAPFETPLAFDKAPQSRSG